MRLRTRSSLGIAGALGALAVAVGAHAGDSPAKRWVCHGTATAEDQNPYVLIYVSDNAILQGHSSHGPRSNPDQIVPVDSTPGEFFEDACLTLWEEENGEPNPE